MTAFEATPHSFVADVIAHDPAALDRLSELHPWFAALREGTVKEGMARLVRFEDAARMVDLPVETVVAVARGEMAAPVVPAEPAEEPAPLPPVGADEELVLDVRPILAAGRDPFTPVMQMQARVPEGGRFVLEAPFDPSPLRRVLRLKGFESEAKRVGRGHWRITFVRSLKPSTRSRDIARTWDEDGVRHLNVRDLDPPAPLFRILETIEDDRLDRLVVHMDREPFPLYPELEARGWDWEVDTSQDEEVLLALTRALS